MGDGQNSLGGTLTCVTKNSWTWLINSIVGLEKVQLNSCLQIAQLYFLALTGIRSKLTGMQEISWNEKNTADLRLCPESNVMILETSGKKSTVFFNILESCFFTSCMILSSLKLSKAIFQPYVFSVLSLSTVLVKIRSIGVQRERMKRKKHIVQIQPQKKSQYQTHLVGILGGICYAVQICTK